MYTRRTAVPNPPKLWTTFTRNLYLPPRSSLSLTSRNHHPPPQTSSWLQVTCTFTAHTHTRSTYTYNIHIHTDLGRHIKHIRYLEFDKFQPRTLMDPKLYTSLVIDACRIPDDSSSTPEILPKYAPESVPRGDLDGSVRAYNINILFAHRLF